MKKILGVVIALVGFVLLIVAIMNYNALMERVGWYLEMFPSSTRYNQEITNYYGMGFIGFILLISGIVIASFSNRKKNK